MPKQKTKTAILSLRVEPAVREALQRAAARERRSLANMAELLILEGCARRESEAPPAVTSTRATINKKTAR